MWVSGYEPSAKGYEAPDGARSRRLRDRVVVRVSDYEPRASGCESDEARSLQRGGGDAAVEVERLKKLEADFEAED